jgi:hypothetical protein
MIGAPQQVNGKCPTAPISLELIGKADTFGRLVDDPGDTGGFDRAEIGDIVMMRKVDNKWVDHHGLRFAALFHCDDGPSYWPFVGHALPRRTRAA